MSQFFKKVGFIKLRVSLDFWHNIKGFRFLNIHIYKYIYIYIYIYISYVVNIFEQGIKFSQSLSNFNFFFFFWEDCLTLDKNWFDAIFTLLYIPKHYAMLHMC